MITHGLHEFKFPFLPIRHSGILMLCLRLGIEKSVDGIHMPIAIISVYP